MVGIIMVGVAFIWLMGFLMGMLHSDQQHLNAIKKQKEP